MKNLKQFLRIILIVIGAFLIADTLFGMSISNMNAGIVLPGILGAPLLLLGIFLPALKRLKWFSFIKYIYIIGYSLFCLLFAGTLAVLIYAANKPVVQDVDALIILGAGLRGERPTRILSERLDTALEYLADNPNTVLVLSGGQGEGEDIPEAEAMARYVANKGLPQDRFIKEPTATNTLENFAFSYQIILERFGEDATIGYVTTNFHIYRAGKVAQKQGIAITTSLASPDLWYISLNNYLREFIAVWAYALLGRI